MARGIFVSSYLVNVNKNFREWLLIALAIVILGLGEYVSLFGFVRQAGERWWGWWGQRVDGVTTQVLQPFTTFQTLRSTQLRVRDLEQKYAQALSQIGELAVLRQENQDLKKMITNNAQQQAIKTVTIPIISYGKPLIAAGSDQGLVPGMMVLNTNTLLGVVGDVSYHQSAVTLLTQESAPRILVRTESGVTGIVKGDGQRVLLTEIPVEKTIAVGERVMTKGQAGIMPNVLIGVVSEVKNQPTAAVQTIVIDQIISFYETTLIEIK